MAIITLPTKQLCVLHFSLTESFLFSATWALIIHTLYKRYEIQPSSFFLSLLLLIVPPLVTATVYLQHFSSLSIALPVSFMAFYSSLLASIVGYRISPMHPLSQYPGPRLARVSKFWMTLKQKDGKMNELVKSLHDKYGAYVRIGPNEISCTDVSAIPQILGPAGMPKGPLWEARSNPTVPSLIALRDLHEHARQRKAWNRAFSTTAVKDYEPTVVKRALQLAEEMQNASSNSPTRSVDLAMWFRYFAFDFMGDMAFGGGFEFMRHGDKDDIWHLMERREKYIRLPGDPPVANPDYGFREMAWMMHIPWATQLLLEFPNLIGSVKKFRAFTVECAKKRKEMGSSVKDLFYHLTNEDGVQLSAPNLTEILAQGELAVIAGSDTTANAMAGIFYYLLTHPATYRQLREEVDSYFPPGEGNAVDASRLIAMPFLNAVINETLRLQPVVMTYIQRAPAKGSRGHWIGDKYLAEGNAVVVPIYAIHRDPKNFSPLPDDFIPERWLGQHHTGDDLKHYSEGASGGTVAEKDGAFRWNTNTTAFIPFSYGPANCAGKNLALAEMRCVLAVLIQHFEFKFVDGYEPKEYQKDLCDWFTTHTGRLPIVLAPRA